MPSDDIERPPEALDVVTRYLRRERPVSALVVVLAVSLFLGTYLATSLLPAVVVAAVLLVTARSPVLQSRGTFRLRTDAERDAVVDEFTGPIPPVLALQWGAADEVTTDDGVAIYTVSYLFGLRSVAVSVRTRTDAAPNGDCLVESEVTVNAQPWATYTSTIGETNDRTVIEVEYTSNRRFGLRRIPQQLVANRYRDDALAAQGYTVVERDAHFGL
ncbi:hypothetical protein [Halarchaeum nitratireducens]|uniref:Uncharacterized protein n=1 Tax=Halarchaeum nitratireducens TaxID=489913 RepID=A0A830G9P6_9EURY|nr:MULTISPECIES: hypothetical protein [Halarchaeum]MBP2249721.1 hypothetical protein [Halarchaeum solikamskense]GGN11027.1 hypothetical protein GCM10009021_08730 [Halarchaeum nitratireducens]